MTDARDIELLLVEDNPEDAEVTMRTLSKEGVANKVVWIKDGAEALDFLFCRGAWKDRDPNHIPRVILLDLKLPKVSGLEVLQQVRTDPRTRMIPVVVLTSSTQDEDIVRSYQLGVNSYVSKPVTFEQFARVVAHLGMYWMLINKAPPAGAASAADTP